MTRVTLTSMTLVRSSTRRCSTTHSASARRLLVPDARVPAVRSSCELSMDSASQSLCAGLTICVRIHAVTVMADVVAIDCSYDRTANDIVGNIRSSLSQSWVPAGMGKRGHLSPLWKCCQVFCCALVITAKRPAVDELFMHNF